MENLCEFKRIEDGPNVYTVVEELGDRHVLLECIYFGAPEDLGDGILCTRENQRICIARYFFDSFYRIIL